MKTKSHYYDALYIWLFTYKNIFKISLIISYYFYLIKQILLIFLN